VIAVDGLRASALGAFGNTSFPTPALDRLAAESLLVEWCYAASADLPDIYRALWNGSESAKDSTGQSLARLFREAGYATTLVSDDPSLASLAGTGDFEKTIELGAEHSSHPIAKQSKTADTEMARAFSVVMDQLTVNSAGSPKLLWLHTRGMYGSWDAPLHLQETLLDEEDASAIDSVNPPNVVIGDQDDPDLAFRYACAYGSQIMVLDDCVDKVLETLETAADMWVVSLLGTRGFPLGEHGRIGGIDGRMYAEQVHVPWMIRLPSLRGRLTRTAALASHCDLPATLAEAIGPAAGVDQRLFGGCSIAQFATSRRAPVRDSTISTSPIARSIRTSSWCLREDIGEGDDHFASHRFTTDSELYVRPDDRWEANDVAKLCPEVVEELRARFDAC
jgi:arylsulfatase A-like enzyme